MPLPLLVAAVATLLFTFNNNNPTDATSPSGTKHETTPPLSTPSLPFMACAIKGGRSQLLKVTRLLVQTFIGIHGRGIRFLWFNASRTLPSRVLRTYSRECPSGTAVPYSRNVIWQEQYHPYDVLVVPARTLDSSTRPRQCWLLIQYYNADLLSYGMISCTREVGS